MRSKSLEKKLLDEEMLQWLKSDFMAWLLGWPNLACHKLTLLGDEITRLETTLGILLAAISTLDKQLYVVELTGEAEVDNNREEWSWSVRLWKE